jgi:hypothetical protein
MGKSSGNRERVGTQDTVRVGIRIRIRSRFSNALRGGMDFLEVLDSRRPRPGKTCTSYDLPDDDSNDHFATAEPPSDGTATGPEATAAVEESQLIGARQAKIVIRLSWDGANLIVDPVAMPRSGSHAAAVMMLCLFVQQCFARGLEKLNPAERRLLLEGGDDSIGRRLCLLGRLAVIAEEKVALPLDNGGTAKRRIGSDIGLERFAYKFAALPDGTPFSLRLLLQDNRGKNKGAEPAAANPLDPLPLSIKLLALRRVFALERQQGSAYSDFDFCPEYQKALEQLIETPIDMPDRSHVRRFRELLVRRHAGHLFPNAKERDKQYQEEKANKKEDTAARVGHG